MIENLVNFDFIISLKTAPEPDFYFPATKSKTDILLQTLVLVYLRLTINGSQPIFSPQENDALHGFYIKFSICIINRKMYKMNIKSASHE